MRLVLDTNVIISAVVGQGAPNRLMRIARKKPIQIYTSAELLNELDDVLRRRKFARRLGQLNLDATAVVAQFQKISTTISVPACYPHVARDPKDDKVLACASAAQATFIISGDIDLLVLIRHQNIPIIRPRQALQRIVFRSGFP